MGALVVSLFLLPERSHTVFVCGVVEGRIFKLVNIFIKASFDFVPQSALVTSLRTKRLSHSRRSFVIPRFVPFGDGGAFVVGFLAFGKGDLDLGSSVF